MNRDRTKQFKTNRRRKHCPDVTTHRARHRCCRNVHDDWSTGSSFEHQPGSDIRTAADLLRSCSSGWLSVYLGCVADGSIALHRCETESPRVPMRPHKPKHWICKAWSRVCTTASVARANNPTLFALVDVVFVAWFLWIVVTAFKP